MGKRADARGIVRFFGVVSGEAQFLRPDGVASPTGDWRSLRAQFLVTVFVRGLNWHHAYNVLLLCEGSVL